MSLQSMKVEHLPSYTSAPAGSPVDMRDTVLWLMITLKNVLEGKPVKDADEVILHAERALAVVQPEAGWQPVIGSLGSLSPEDKLAKVSTDGEDFRTGVSMTYIYPNLFPVSAETPGVSWVKKPHKFTPGPWELWTNNSTRRISGADGKDGGVMYAATPAGKSNEKIQAAGLSGADGKDGGVVYASGPRHMETIVVSKENAKLILATTTVLNAAEVAEEFVSGKSQLSRAEVLRILRGAIDDAL